MKYLTLLFLLIGSNLAFAGGGLNGLKVLEAVAFLALTLISLVIAGIISAITSKGKKLMAFGITLLICLTLIVLWKIFGSF